MHLVLISPFQTKQNPYAPRLYLLICVTSLLQGQRKLTHVTYNSWDDWVPQDRVRKYSEENKELAAQLHVQMKTLQQKQTSSAKAAKKGGRANGSDFSSARGSEERNLSTAAQGGRGGQRKNRDYELETVSS